MNVIWTPDNVCDLIMSDVSELDYGLWGALSSLGVVGFVGGGLFGRAFGRFSSLRACSRF